MREHRPDCAGYEDCQCFHTSVSNEGLAALIAIARAARDVVEARYHPQFDMTEKLDGLEIAMIDFRNLEKLS